MRRLNQMELEDALIGRRVEAVRVELSVAQAIRTDASPERHFAFESLRLFCVFRVEAHADGTLHVLAAVLAQVEVRFIAEHQHETNRLLSSDCSPQRRRGAAEECHPSMRALPVAHGRTGRLSPAGDGWCVQSSPVPSRS